MSNVTTQPDRSLYQVTGDIKDINTILISRTELNRLRQAVVNNAVERVQFTEQLTWSEP